MESITLEQALELFKFPRVIGAFEDHPMEVKLGRFGPYIEHNGAFYSLAKDDDPYTIVGPRGIEVILARRQKIAENTIKTFDEDPSVKVLKGRWGPYVVVGKQNVRLPKGTDATLLTLEDCLQLAQQQAPAPKTKKSSSTGEKATKSAGAKKTTARKTPAKKAAVKKTAAKKTATRRATKKS
jgi:DNA topoisomerase-1